MYRYVAIFFVGFTLCNIFDLMIGHEVAWSYNAFCASIGVVSALLFDGAFNERK
jgi:hypothetical protein